MLPAVSLSDVCTCEYIPVRVFRLWPVCWASLWACIASDHKTSLKGASLLPQNNNTSLKGTFFKEQQQKQTALLKAGVQVQTSFNRKAHRKVQRLRYHVLPKIPSLYQKWRDSNYVRATPLVLSHLSKAKPKSLSINACLPHRLHQVKQDLKQREGNIFTVQKT